MSWGLRKSRPSVRTLTIRRSLNANSEEEKRPRHYGRKLGPLVPNFKPGNLAPSCALHCKYSIIEGLPKVLVTLVLVVSQYLIEDDRQDSRGDDEPKTSIKSIRMTYR